jgi:hypothetical protein
MFGTDRLKKAVVQETKGTSKRSFIRAHCSQAEAVPAARNAMHAEFGTLLQLIIVAMKGKVDAYTSLFHRCRLDAAAINGSG